MGGFLVRREPRTAPPSHDGDAVAPADALAGGSPATNGCSGGIVFEFVTRVEDTESELCDGQAVPSTSEEDEAEIPGRQPRNMETASSYWLNVRSTMTCMVDQAVLAGQRVSDGMIRDLQEVRTEFRTAVRQVGHSLHRLVDQVDERLDDLESRVNEVYGNRPPPPYPSSVDSAATDDDISHSTADQHPEHDVEAEAALHAGIEDGTSPSTSAINDLNRGGQAATPDEHTNVVTTGRTWLLVDSDSDNAGDPVEDSPTLFETCGEAEKTSTPSEGPPVGIGFPPTPPTAWLRERRSRGAIRYLNWTRILRERRHTEGHRPGGRSRADSPAPWSPELSYLTGTEADGEDGNESCAGWSSSDLTGDTLHTRMIQWEGSEEERAADPDVPDGGQPQLTRDEETTEAMGPAQERRRPSTLPKITERWRGIGGFSGLRGSLRGVTWTDARARERAARRRTTGYFSQENTQTSSEEEAATLGNKRGGDRQATDE
jgi:hypothetical protein